MAELKSGDHVPLTIGIQATVKKELGRGGQGIVYLVEVNGQDMALKWYLDNPSEGMYNNLSHNIAIGAPSDAFLWPKYLTLRCNGSAGYIMDLRPQGYYEFGMYLLARARFKSDRAMINSAFKICDSFRELHAKGLSYQDLNDGGIFIRPEDGDVLVCDTDNVAPTGSNITGIKGKARYMAPEVVAGSNPDSYSDRFSLSLILFMLFMRNHPFEGTKVVNYSCMTEELEKKLYGNEAVFIYDPTDTSNRPAQNIHSNVIRRWPVFPEILRQTFIDEFSKDKLQNPQKRMVEALWIKVITAIRDNLLRCSKCQENVFFDFEQGKDVCPNCGQRMDTSLRLNIGTRSIVLALENPVYVNRDCVADGKVVEDPAVPGKCRLANRTDHNWQVTTPHKVITVEPRQSMPIKDGLKINFGEFDINGLQESGILQVKS